MTDNIIRAKFRPNGRQRRALRAQENHFLSQDEDTGLDHNFEGDPQADLSGDYGRGSTLKSKATIWFKGEWDVTRITPPIALGVIAACGAIGVAGTPEIVGGGQTAKLVQYFLMFIALYQIAKLSFRNVFFPVCAFALAIVVMNSGLLASQLSGSTLLYAQLGLIAVVIGFGCRCMDLGRRQ